MPNACICHTELVAFGYEDCDYCEAVDFDDDDPTDLSVLTEDCLYDNYSSDSC